MFRSAVRRGFRMIHQWNGINSGSSDASADAGAGRGGDCGVFNGGPDEPKESQDNK